MKIFAGLGREKPGSVNYRTLQGEYLEKIKPLAQVSLIETPEARGLEENGRIKFWRKKPVGLKNMSGMDILSAFPMQEKN